jgi:hypothetical protein
MICTSKCTIHGFPLSITGAHACPALDAGSPPLFIVYEGRSFVALTRKSSALGRSLRSDVRTIRRPFFPPPKESGAYSDATACNSPFVHRPSPTDVCSLNSLELSMPGCSRPTSKSRRDGHPTSFGFLLEPCFINSLTN